MVSKQEIGFPVSGGIKTYAPEISSTPQDFSVLDNVRASFFRLLPTRGHLSKFDLADETAWGLAYVFNVGLQTLQFYVITNSSAYLLNVDDADVFSLSLVGTYNWTEESPIAWASWDDDLVGAVYFTKLGTPIYRLTRSELTELSATFDPGGGLGIQKLSAKYMAIVQNRLVVANILMAGEAYPRRVQWSDVYNPEDFQLTSGKESDLWDLETGNLEITGLESHRGYMIIFTRRSIWRATYVGYPQIFRFEPLFSDFGNIYHYSVVNAKDTLFFIGNDNFYTLDGFTPIEIGDDVWKFWLDTNATRLSHPLQGFADTSKHEVFWKYRRKGRQDVPVGDVYLTDFNWELLTVSYQTLVYRGYYNGDHSWSLSYTEPDGTVETFLFLCKSLSTGKWTFFQNSFSLPADLSEVRPDDSWEIKGEYSGDIIGTSSADWGAGFSFSSLNPGSGWDYRRYEHDWILAYNYKEKRWSTRAAHGMVSLYSNPYAIQAFRVIDEFNENWTEGGLFEAPVYADEYPWADIVFATQERVSGTTVLVTTTEAHNLQSGLLVNVVNSVPTNFNAKDVEITAINANTFSYPSVGSNGNATTIGTILGRRIDGSWQYSNFPSVALVGRKGNLAVYEGGEFEDENGNSIFSEVTTHELFFGSIMDTKEPSEVKLVYKGVGNPRVTLQVGYRDHQMEDMRWTEEAEPLVLSIEGELRYNLQFSLRSKFFTFKIKAYNTATDYVQEFLGGSLFISGMLNKGTEL